MEMETNVSLAMEALGPFGFVIGREQRAALGFSLPLKKKEASLSSLSLWGRVLATNGKDYLLARACNGIRKIESKLAFDTKSYYSQDGVKWMDLQPLSDEIYEACKTIKGYYSGEPSHTYSVSIKLPPPLPTLDEAAVAELPKAPEPETEENIEKQENEEAEVEIEIEEKDQIEINEDGEETQESKEISEEESKETNVLETTKTVEIGELDRLSSLIQQVDHECGVVPRGSFVFDANKHLVRNIYFPGIENAEDLTSYTHLFQGYKEALLDKDINGSWSIEVSPLQNDVFLRNMWWPGYVFYYTSLTKDFGSLYFGTGEKNHNLPFMI